MPLLKPTGAYLLDLFELENTVFAGGLSGRVGYCDLMSISDLVLDVIFDFVFTVRYVNHMCTYIREAYIVDIYSFQYLKVSNISMFFLFRSPTRYH